jgi:MFS family permease
MPSAASSKLPASAPPGGLVDTRGEPINDRRLRTGMRTNIIAGSFGMVWVAVAGGMPITMFMDAIGASGVAIGMSVTVQQFAMLLQVPAAFIGEMLATRKLYWGILALLHRACWLLIACLPWLCGGNPQLMAFALLLLLTASSLLAQAATPVWFGWMADLIPERSRSTFWAVRQSVVMIPFLIATVLAGYALDLFPDPRTAGGSYLGYGIVFGIAGLLGCVDILIHLKVPEPRTVPIRFAARQIAERLLAPLKSADFRWLTLSLCVWSFALSVTGQFGVLALKRIYLASYTEISWTAVTATLGVIAGGFLWGYVMNRVGARNFGILSMILAPLCGAVWFLVDVGSVDLQLPFGIAFALPQMVVALLLVNLVAGALFSGVGLAQMSLLGALSPAQGRTMFMAVHWALIGLAAAAGPLLGGWVMDWVTAHPVTWVPPTGIPLNFLHLLVLLQAALCWFVAVPMLYKVRRRTGEMALGTAFNRLVTINPLRMMASISNIWSMGSSDTRSERAGAARRLGEERTALAVADLIVRLDDPSLEVREEAATALGSIGSDDAIDALLLRLEDPRSDLVPEIVRALRQEHTGASLESILRRITLPIAELLPQISSRIPDGQRRRIEAALIRLLPAADQVTACEIVRTLGVVGFRAASGPALLAYLHTASEPKLAVACSEALVRLEELAAAAELVSRATATTDRRHCRALTVNLGDLIGEPGGFYRLLAQEERKPGSRAEEMLAHLAEAVTHVCRANPASQAEGRRVAALIGALDVAYVEGRIAVCVQHLFEIGRFVVGLELDLPPPAGDDGLDTWIAAASEANPRTGAGMRYLKQLRDGLGRKDGSAPDAIGVLLGIYFLSGWARTYRGED